MAQAMPTNSPNDRTMLSAAIARAATQSPVTYSFRAPTRSEKYPIGAARTKPTTPPAVRAEATLPVDIPRI
jgi:hypothetical protein